jgi:hypothetical protein
VIDRRRAEEARADQVFDQHRATYERALAEHGAHLCDVVNARLGRPLLTARWTLGGFEVATRVGTAWQLRRSG